MPERVPPHDVLAEQSVLGSMMLSPAAVWDVLSAVESGDFYEPRHEQVFDAVEHLVRRGVGVDALSVGDELGRRGQLERMGGPAFLHELTGIPSSTTNAGYHAGIVKGLAVRRRMIDAGQQIAGWGFSLEGEVNEQVELARAAVDRVAGGQQVEAQPIGTAYDQVVESLGSKPNLIPTPWPELNEILVGLQPGRLYVVGARPGEGKSMVGLQLADALCARGPVAFSSLEMTRAEVMARLFASKANVNMTSIERSTLTEEEWQRVAEARSLLTSMPLHLDERTDVGITQIKAYARSVSRKGQLAGVVVDYLQLVSGPSRMDRREVVSEISRNLKIMAKEFHCPVIALSQLNRDSAARGKVQAAPSLADLRESGSIEQDADLVLLLQRVVEKDGRPGDQIRFHVAKNRHGKTGYRTLRWNGAYARVEGWNRYGLGPSRVED